MPPAPVLSLLLLASPSAVSVATATPRGRPHLIYILSDNLGWGNVGYHRKISPGGASPEVVTPRIDQLVETGIDLDRLCDDPTLRHPTPGPPCRCWLYSSVTDRTAARRHLQVLLAVSLLSDDRAPANPRKYSQQRLPASAHTCPPPHPTCCQHRGRPTAGSHMANSSAGLGRRPSPALRSGC